LVILNLLPTSDPFGGITQIATDPSGQSLYLLDYSGVYVYAIGGKTGALMALPGSAPSSAVRTDLPRV